MPNIQIHYIPQLMAHSLKAKSNFFMQTQTKHLTICAVLLQVTRHLQTSLYAEVTIKVHIKAIFFCLLQ